MKWKLEEEEDYFKIYDSKKNVAGYLDPDYGKAGQDTIDAMLKNHEFVRSAFLMLPMVKFGIFDSERMQVHELHSRLENALARTDAWRNCLGKLGAPHWIGVSHTDHDMLSITIPIAFSEPVPLVKDRLRDAVSPTLDGLQQLGLL